MLIKFQQIRNSKEEGFTLIELLVVIIIIGVLASIALPLYNQQQTRAHEASVMGALRAKVLGVQTYLIKNPNAVDTVTNTPAGRPISEASKGPATATYEFGVAQGPFAPDASKAGKELRNTGSYARWDAWSISMFSRNWYGKSDDSNFAISYYSATNKYTIWRGTDDGTLVASE